MKAIFITFECFCEELEVRELLSLFSDFGKFFFFIVALYFFWGYHVVYLVGSNMDWQIW